MANPKTRSQSQAARIQRAITLEILKGDRVPGSSLPPVRSLATDYDVTPPTVQRAIDRLASQGLVTARRGSGVTVNDPQRAFDLSLLPLWFEAVADDPPRAGKLLGDFLELRRVVATHLVRTSLPRLVEVAGSLSQLAENLQSATTPAERMDADLAFTRAVVAACNQQAVGAVFSVAERLVREVPAVAVALYADENAHREALAGVLHAITSRDAESAARGMEDALSAWDQRAVRDLVDSLESHST